MVEVRQSTPRHPPSVICEIVLTVVPDNPVFDHRWFCARTGYIVKDLVTNSVFVLVDNVIIGMRESFNLLNVYTVCV
jgi:hypothetical protein